MNYARVKNNSVVEYPFNAALLKQANPNTSFPKQPLEKASVRESYGVVEVVTVSKPRSDTYNVAEVTPVKVGGTWTQTWEQTPKNDSELAQAYDSAMIELRSRRNQLLASSDWTQVADVALTVEDDIAWRDYRKALRDLPAGLSTADDVANVDWPTAP
jgi:hypothetical protein